MTHIEDLIKQIQRGAESGQLIVPKIEKFLQNPVAMEDKLDRAFMSQLFQARYRERMPGVFSPSMLASCTRQVFFYKTGKDGKKQKRIDSNGIFLDGDFRHFKWQFVLWKMHRAGIIQLLCPEHKPIGTEIFVLNESGNYGGTLDQIYWLPEEKMVVINDYKGMNGNNFASYTAKGISLRYTSQAVGYAILGNSVLSTILPKKIEKVIILGENKNGAVFNRKIKSPLGLYEWVLDVEQYHYAIAKRLKSLRSYEKRNEVPPPECISVTRMMFRDCPYNKHCRGEVEKIQAQLKKVGKDQRPKFQTGH